MVLHYIWCSQELLVGTLRYDDSEPVNTVLALSNYFYTNTKGILCMNIIKDKEYLSIKTGLGNLL